MTPGTRFGASRTCRMFHVVGEGATSVSRVASRVRVTTVACTFVPWRGALDQDKSLIGA